MRCHPELDQNSDTLSSSKENLQPQVSVVVQMKDNTLLVLGYDLKKGVWLNPERLPLAKQERYEIIPRIIAVGDTKLYIVGGRAMGSCLNTMYVFNTLSKDIKLARCMVHPRAGHGVAELNGFIYVAGGFNSTGYLDAMERYDTQYDTWEPLAPLIEPKVGISMAALRDHLYCIGGWDGEQAMSNVECYDSAVNQWTKVANLPSSRYGVGAASMDGQLYVIGGREDTDKWITQDTLLVYDPANDRWSSNETNTPFLPDEYFMVAWNQQIWLTSFKGKQMLSYDFLKDQMMHPEQASFLKNCWGPLGIVMLSINP